LQSQLTQKKVDNYSTLADIQQKKNQAAVDYTNAQIKEQKIKLDALQAAQQDKKNFNDFSSTFNGTGPQAAAQWLKKNPTSKVAGSVVNKVFSQAKNIAKIDPAAAGRILSKTLGVKIVGSRGKDGFIKIEHNGTVTFIDPDNYKVIKQVSVGMPKDTRTKDIKNYEYGNAHPGFAEYQNGNGKVSKKMTKPVALDKIAKARSKIAKLAATGGVNAMDLIAAGKDASKLMDDARMSKETKDAVNAEIAYIKELEKTAYPEKAAKEADIAHAYAVYRNTMSPKDAMEKVMNEFKGK